LIESPRKIKINKKCRPHVEPRHAIDRYLIKINKNVRFNFTGAFGGRNYRVKCPFACSSNYETSCGKNVVNVKKRNDSKTFLQCLRYIK